MRAETLAVVQCKHIFSNARAKTMASVFKLSFIHSFINSLILFHRAQVTLKQHEK